MAEAKTMKDLPWRYRILFVGLNVNLLLLMTSPFVALISKPTAALMAAGALAGNMLVHHAMGFAALEESPEDPYPRFRVLNDPRLTAAYLIAFALLFAGLASALLDHDVGAYLLIGGMVGRFGANAAIGVTRYREVMQRPWPAVAPLDDEDDW